jgi:AmmeMemoRadiSam system protein B/AmmeMemoRadiSam system protein A
MQFLRLQNSRGVAMKKNTCILLFILLLIGCTAKPVEQKIVRAPAVSGSWYPGSASELTQIIDEYYKDITVESLGGIIKAVIVPHAGWRFSGKIAATAFNQIEGKKYKTVIIIGTSHYTDFGGASIGNYTHFQTPLGEIKLSDKRNILLKEKNFVSHPTADLKEHSIEIELPFLQKSLGDFELIPILLGFRTTYSQINEIAGSLKKVIDDSTLIAVSSDFTHYGPNYQYIPFSENIEENLKTLDDGAFSYIAAKDAFGFYNYVEQTQDTICNRYGITLLLRLFENTDVNVKKLSYDTSGRQLNDFTNSVSYESIIFYQQDITEEEKEYLLTLARETLNSYVMSGKVPAINEDTLNARLLKVQGCFVTLNKDGNLRGCIGHILPQEPLYKCVIDNAVNAAAHDMRFSPVKPEELKDIEVEVSVLSVPEEIKFNSSEEILNTLQPNVHGVVLQYNSRQSTYLPQVWEQLPDKETFLSQLCIKQGSQSDCWQQSNVKVYTYTAAVFNEQ